MLAKVRIYVTLHTQNTTTRTSSQDKQRWLMSGHDLIFDKIIMMVGLKQPEEPPQMQIGVQDMESRRGTRSRGPPSSTRGYGRKAKLDSDS